MSRQSLLKVVRRTDVERLVGTLQDIDEVFHQHQSILLRCFKTYGSIELGGNDEWNMR
jgi:hypothetical protein